MSMQDIFVVGGGIGGTMTANNLVTKLYPEIRWQGTGQFDFQ